MQPSARLFETGPVLWVMGNGISVRRTPPSATLLRLPAPGGRFALKTLLKRLAGMGVQSLLVEGGGETAGDSSGRAWFRKRRFFME